MARKSTILEKKHLTLHFFYLQDAIYFIFKALTWVSLFKFCYIIYIQLQLYKENMIKML